MRNARRSSTSSVLFLALLACTKETTAPPQPSRPSILLITLDTTRADAMGPSTPEFNALAARGLRFRQAYATTPQTLPSHSSMMTGLYPGGHGVHENGRRLSDAQPLLAEKLRAAGYRTAAFVSAFALDRRFGLARGFDVYDDKTPPRIAERTAKETTDAALAFLAKETHQPLFLWVHYYDPHYPYTPPAPHRGYLGEVASMDEQMGRLVREFETRGETAIIVVADHGEGLGDHGEDQHGNLLYQSTMHVPFVVVGNGVKPGTSDTPVSTRRVFRTIMELAEGTPASAPAERAASRRTTAARDAAGSAAGTAALHLEETVIAGEAMKPFLDYGWQPQVMAVEGTRKAIFAGKLEVYDVIADPRETRDLASSADLSREVRATLRDYPIPSLQSAASATPASEEERRKLASLGYVAAEVKPVVRKDAPRAADMTALFPILDQAAALFVREQYREAIPLLEQILARDPHNLDAALRLATAHSSLGHDQKALEAYRRAQSIAPESPDVRTYLALHYARGKDWEKAVPMLERIMAESPERVPVLEALAVVRERQGRIAESIALREKLYALRDPSPAELARLGELAMRVGNTPVAIAAFEKAGRGHDLELGVLYLAARRFEDARTALDRVPPSHPGYPMALFKRAQVSVLLREPDARARIDAARANANAETRELIERERLFQ